jgi:hypothetical protein
MKRYGLTQWLLGMLGLVIMWAGGLLLAYMIGSAAWAVAVFLWSLI